MELFLKYIFKLTLSYPSKRENKAEGQVKTSKDQEVLKSVLSNKKNKETKL